MAHQAKKRFGQNFLTDHGIIQGIVEAISPQAEDNLIEIGPGLGALTVPLLQRIPQMQVIELDRDLVARLQQQYSADRLMIHSGDVLNVDFGTMGENMRIVGNLPYNISSPLLFHLVPFASRIQDMHFMLQKEVVERIVAQPSTRDYGRLTVMLQYHFWAEMLFEVPPESFSPAPKVDSAIVRLVPRVGTPDGLPAPNSVHFSQLVARSFAQRRKTLRNNLKGVLDDADFHAIGIEPSTRPECLSLGDFVRLTHAFSAKAGTAI